MVVTTHDSSLCSGGASAGASENAEDGWCVWDAVTPREGRLVLFPSWLLHCVLPFEPAAADDHCRISVAFSIGREEEGPEEGAPS